MVGTPAYTVCITSRYHREYINGCGIIVELMTAVLHRARYPNLLHRKNDDLKNSFTFVLVLVQQWKMTLTVLNSGYKTTVKVFFVNDIPTIQSIK